MTTPAPVVSRSRPKWQTLLSRTLLRLRIISAARRGLRALLVLAAAYAAFLMTMRLTGILRLTPEALALHEQLVGEVWRRALKGPAATAYLNRLLKSASDSAHRDNRKVPARQKTGRSRR